jgi:hypothetical protein
LGWIASLLNNVERLLNATRPIDDAVFSREEAGFLGCIGGLGFWRLYNTSGLLAAECCLSHSIA